MKNPLVSIIVPTKNSQQFLEACLKSIKEQTYKEIEIIVIDNNSTDVTKAIAKRYTNLVFTKGPERSSQRNFGAMKAHGLFLLFIDSDMQLTKNVVKECVQEIQHTKFGGLIIPEQSIGKGFWAACIALEKSFYLGVEWIEAARFFHKNVFRKQKGFDESLVSGEDWDLSQRIKRSYKLGRITSYLMHNEGTLTLTKILSKKYYYAKKISQYVKKNKKEFNIQSNILKRYFLFFSHPKKLFANPFLGLGVLFLKTSEFVAGAVGYTLT